MSAALLQISLLLLAAAILAVPTSSAPLPQQIGTNDHDSGGGGRLVEVQIVDHDGHSELDDIPQPVTVTSSPPIRRRPTGRTTSNATPPPPMTTTPAVTPVSVGDTMPSLYSLFDLIQTNQTPRQPQPSGSFAPAPPPAPTIPSSSMNPSTRYPSKASSMPPEPPGLSPAERGAAPRTGGVYQGSESSPVADAFRGWAVFDDLDTGETANNTAVIAPQKKFGYIVHNNEHRRFRVEEKAPDGYIQGLFGMVGGNGDVRGVRYTADPSISPKFLFDTLQKFLSL